MEKEFVKFSDVLVGTIRRWKLILVVAIIAIISATLIPINKSYKASTTLYLKENQKEQEINQLVEKPKNWVPTYIQLIKTQKLVESALKNSNSNLKVSEVIGGIETSEVKDTNFIRVSYTSSNEEQSEEVLKAIVNEVTSNINNIDANNSIVQTENIVVSSNNREAKKIKIIILGVLAGIFGGIFLAFLLECFDTTYKTAGELERDFGKDVIAKIPSDSKSIKVLDSNSEYNILINKEIDYIATRVKALNREGKKIFLMISSVRKEGVTTILDRLSKAVTQGDKKILVVNCDPNKQVSKDNISIGLTDLILNNKNKEDIIKSISTNLDIIEYGDKSVRYLNVIDNNNFEVLLNKLKLEYDSIIIQSEPLKDSAAGQLLSKFVDGIIFIVRSQKVNRKIVKESVGLLQEESSKVVGFVLNGINKFRYKF